MHTENELSARKEPHSGTAVSSRGKNKRPFKRKQGKELGACSSAEVRSQRRSVHSNTLSEIRLQPTKRPRCSRGVLAATRVWSANSVRPQPRQRQERVQRLQPVEHPRCSREGSCATTAQPTDFRNSLKSYSWGRFASQFRRVIARG